MTASARSKMTDDIQWPEAAGVHVTQVGDKTYVATTTDEGWDQLGKVLYREGLDIDFTSDDVLYHDHQEFVSYPVIPLDPSRLGHW